MNTKRYFILARRVIQQMLADRRALALMFVIPVILLTFLGVLIRNENGGLEIGIVDHTTLAVGGETPGTRLKTVLKDFGDFKVVSVTADEAQDKLEAGDLDAAVTVSMQMGDDGANLILDIAYEGSNPMIADRLDTIFERASLQAVNGLMNSAATTSAASAVKVNLDVNSAYLHGGSEYDTLDYMAPALIGFFVFFFLFLLTCIAFLRERVAGTLERLQATPIRPVEVIVGYMGGFLVFGLLQGVLVLLFTVFVLNIHYAGNLLNIFVVEFLLVMVSVNLGIFLSTFAQNEFQVLQFIPLVVVTQGLLGGVIWEIKDLPGWLQPLSYLMPLTYATDALRNVMIKGESLWDVAGQVAILFGFALLVIVLSARTAGRAKI